MKKGLLIVMMLPLMAIGQTKMAHPERLEADFVQTRQSVALMAPQVVSGTFRYLAPDSIDWQYQDNHDATLPQPILQMIQKTISGEVNDIEKDFETRWQANCLTLVPRKKQIQRFFSSISLWFNAQGVANKVLLTEPNGDTTEIQFNHIRIN